MSNVPAQSRADGMGDAIHLSMTTPFPMIRERRTYAVERDPVCARCGHGESLHPQRDLACLVCDQRADVGLPSSFCVGFLSNIREAAPV